MSKVVILFFITFLASCSTPLIDQAKTRQAAQLVGWWKEYSPSSNLVHFSKNGSLRIMLKKGEIGNPHSLQGTWAITADNIVHIEFSHHGTVVKRESGISFDNGEMILTGKTGIKTKLRRHSGSLPKEYVW